jgi:mannan endo-1,6-alpha-mannosidase
LDSASGQYWSELNQQLLDAALRVFVYEDTDIVFEVACEPSMNCNTDQQGFRAGFVRSLATLRDLAPAEDDRVPRDAIGQVLRASATAAAAACTEGNGTTCALNWYEPTTDDFSGSNYHINQNLNALEVFLANLPVGEIKTGSVSENGTSAGGSDTGIDASGSENDTSSAPASTGSGTGAASSVMVSSMLTVAGLFAAMLVVV